MTALNVAVPVWYVTDCEKMDGSDYKYITGDILASNFVLKSIATFSGGLLIFSIIKIECEIKKRRAEISTTNLLIHATVFILYTTADVGISITIGILYVHRGDEEAESRDILIVRCICFLLY